MVVNYPKVLPLSIYIHGIVELGGYANKVIFLRQRSHCK